MRRAHALAVMAVAMAYVAAGVARGVAAMDRHPELKSRPFAWSPYDGSYLVDTSSRAEMLDFYWTVFAAPYPHPQWTGSINPPVAGQVCEAYRIRSIAQTNAYRALNGSPPLVEDASKNDYVQAGALIIAQNPDKPIKHIIDSTWVGYNAVAADAVMNGLLAGEWFRPGVDLCVGSADDFINDTGQPSWVGHRSTLLHDATRTISVGAVRYEPTPRGPEDTFATVWYLPFEATSGDAADYVAWPSPGYVPIGYMRYPPVLPWSFASASDDTDFRAGTDQNFFTYAEGLVAKDTTITAKINGRDVTVHDIRRNIPPGPLVWDFGTALDFSNGDFAEDTVVEVTIHDLAILTPRTLHVERYRDYTYTVTLFDERKVTCVGYAPKTALVNMSTRAAIGSDQRQLITGFSVSGALPVRVALRAQGPGLAKYGVQNAAKSTRLRVYDSAGIMLGENTGWRRHQDWRLLESYGLAPASDGEAAMVLTLWPGNYTAIAGDDLGDGGVGTVEVFDIDSLTTAQLGNLSTRGVVGTGDSAMIAGMVVKDVPRTVVIRTQGPGLAKYGVSRPVSDTVLTVVSQTDGKIVAENDDWETGSRNARLRSDLSTLAPSNPREAALVLTLQPGAYTALVTPKGDPGIGIVEIFAVQP